MFGQRKEERCFDCMLVKENNYEININLLTCESYMSETVTLCMLVSTAGDSEPFRDLSDAFVQSNPQ